MASPYDLFEDDALVQRIKNRLPYLFFLAEKMASRGGKAGMEVGTLREQILIALFIHKFGRESVELGGITEQHDVRVLGYPISIKTAKSPSSRPSLKVWWGSDNEKILDFKKRYYPNSILMVAVINWGATGPLALVPKEVQEEVFEDVTPDGYLRARVGTNNRGVEIPGRVVARLLEDPRTRRMAIYWQAPYLKDVEWIPYLRWLEYWEMQEDPPSSLT
ncbi:MAG: ThaI family type II restriction endonuclease [Thermus sp.]|uniref:ThaI family type II restriction endonuclease n=1 Tax=Thermus sp. TaxID=275 RepID=UPI00391D202C